MTKQTLESFWKQNRDRYLKLAEMSVPLALQTACEDCFDLLEPDSDRVAALSEELENAYKTDAGNFRDFVLLQEDIEAADEIIEWLNCVVEWALEGVFQHP